MHKASFSQRLPLPSDIEETHEALSAVQVWTSSKEQLLLVNNSEKNIVKFSCKTNLQSPSSIDVLYVDGTFKSVSTFFHQLFTIHGLSNGLCMYHLHFSYWPINIKVLWGCIQTFGIIRCKTWCECFSDNYFADFETAIHNAVITVWPGFEVKVCRYHLGQIWWRKIQSLELSKQYGKKYSEVSQFLKIIFGLSHLPPTEVSDRFTLDFISNLPNDKQVERFCDDLLENFIDADSNFPPTVWCEYSA